MVRTSDVRVEATERKPATLPKWAELNSLEQVFMVVLSSKTSSATWWELYRETIRLLVHLTTVGNFRAFGKMSPAALERAKKAEPKELERMLEFYREMNIKLPSQRTFKNMVLFFAYVGWIGETVREKKTYYFANHAVISSIQANINKFNADNGRDSP